MKTTYLITYKIDGDPRSMVSADLSELQTLKLYKFVTDVKVKKIEYKEIPSASE